MPRSDATNAAPRCTRCGALLTGQTVGEQCGSCMLQLALAPAPETVAPPSAPAGDTAPAALDDAIGQNLGCYKLLEKIGEGGCGVVYVAEQAQPVRRRVALKVIKLGMDTRQVVARFEAERQALALMDHPNIARVLDAGTTDAGRPYFIMELVRGIKITDFCDQERLHLPQRLNLFIKVCHAVQHAHQKGIIHRDLKPSNILVTLHDGVPVPKVIDFGIAKATEGRLTDATVYTQLHQFIGTPAYMSPEQAEMSGLDIDTRTDIYSLGVLLYELLTGQTPFDTRQLMSAGLDAFRKAIREQEPTRPSTRLTLEWKARQARLPSGPSGHDRQKSKPPAAAARIPEDLDWIVMKCLEKDRSRRYETANGLAADIQRHLRNEPVTARPPSTAYRLQKAWKRNKLVFTAGTAVVAALVVSLTIISWQMLVARRARDNEAQERAKAEAAEKLAETSAEEATASLYESLLGQARATRMARHVGYREEVFALLRKARDLDTAKKQVLSLRREAVASMGDFVGFHPRLIASPTGANKFARMQLAPSGRVVAICDTDGSIELRELPSGRELGRWKTDSSVRSLAFNRAGDRLVSIHIPLGRMDEETRPEGRKGEERSQVAEFTVDLAGRWRQNVWRPVAGAFAVLTAGNSVLLAVAGDERLQEIQLNDFDSGETVHRLRRSVGSWTPQIAMTSDGRKLALMQKADREHPEAEIELWELPAERMLRRLAPSLGATVTPGFSEDGRYLFGLGEKGTRVFETATFNSLDQFPGYADVVHRGSFLPGTPLLAVPRQQQRRFLIRDFQKQQVVAEFREGTESLASAFSPGGEFLLTLSRNACHLYPFRVAQECQALNGHESAVTAIAFSPDGRRLVSVGKDRSVQLWDSASGRQIWAGDRPLPGLGQAVDFSPDGRLIGTGIWATPLVQLWDAESGRQLVQLTNSATFTWSLRFVPHPEHGLLVISGGVGAPAIQHGIGVWQINSTRAMFDDVDGAVRWVHSRPPPGMMSLVVAPDANHIAFLYKFTGPATAAAAIQDSMGRRPPVELGSVTFSVQALAFMPDGQSVAALMEDNRIVVFSSATGRPQRSFQIAGQSAKDRLIALSPTGRWLAVSSASNCGVDIYEFDTGELRYGLPDREGTTYWLAWHPEEPRLAIARDNGDIAIWDLAKIDAQLEELGLGLGSDRALASAAKSAP